MLLLSKCTYYPLFGTTKLNQYAAFAAYNHSLVWKILSRILEFTVTCLLLTPIVSVKFSREFFKYSASYNLLSYCFD